MNVLKINKSLEFANIPLITYGDEFLPKNSSDMLKTNDYKKNFSIIVGTTDDEGSLLTLILDPKLYSVINTSNLTKSDAKNYLSSLFSSFAAKSMINNDNVYKLYTSQLPEHNYDAIRRSISVPAGDYMLTCPTIE